MRKYFGLLLLNALVAMPAYAAATACNAPGMPDLSDENGLLTALRSHGLTDMTSVNWGNIDLMCAGIDDDNARNCCRYQKALLQQDFMADQDSCQQQAQTTTIQPPALIRSYVSTDANGVKQSVEEYAEQPLDAPDTDAIQASSYNGCMQKLGWKNPDNWMNGQRGGR